VNIWCIDNGRVLDFVISVKQRHVMNFTLADLPFKFLSHHGSEDSLSHKMIIEVALIMLIMEPLGM